MKKKLIKCFYCINRVFMFIFDLLAYVFYFIGSFLNCMSRNVGKYKRKGVLSFFSLRSYTHYLEEHYKSLNDKNNKEFVQFNSTNFVRRSDDAKIMAWYLPQYYEIEVNNLYHGKGFTEWTNASRMRPLFRGHNQPHLPYDIGFYNLTMRETLARQVELANKYGVYGFVFDYYWFAGVKTMDRPLKILLANRDLNIKFCVNWCLENWTQKWDGSSENVIYEQKISLEYAESFVNDLLEVISDERYVRVNNKPMIMFYKCDVVSKREFCTFVEKIRMLFKEKGINDIYVLICNNVDGKYNEWGGDALVEYPTCHLNKFPFYHPNGYIDKNFTSAEWGICDYKNFVEKKRYKNGEMNEKSYKACMTNFDNSSRKTYTKDCTITVNAEPCWYKKWLDDLIVETNEVHSKEDNFVFVLAWNEWAEGAHLEPDLFFGYGYLQATRDSIEQNRDVDTDYLDNALNENDGIKKVYIHCIESLGDIVACEPIARYLKKKYNISVSWIVKEQYSRVIEYNPYIDNIIQVKSLTESVVLLSDLEKEDDAIVVNCHYNYRYDPKTGVVNYNSVNPMINENTYMKYGALLTTFSLVAGLKPLEDAPVFHLDKSIDRINLWKKYIVIHCKSAESCKDWPNKKWHKIVRFLIKKGFDVVEIGLESQLNITNEHFYDYTGEHDIQKIAHVIKNAQMFIGIDSAFAHIANALQVNGVLIFGKYKNFGRYNVYTGFYADENNVKIVWADSDRKAAYVSVDKVVEGINYFI